MYVATPHTHPCGNNDVAEIEQCAFPLEQIHRRPREIVYAEGDAADAFFLLESGHIRLYRITEDGKVITIAILGPGDLFGELALFDRGPRTTFAEAIDDTRLLRVPAGEVIHVMARDPHLTLTIAKRIALRGADAEARIADLAYGTVRGRLVASLRRLAGRHGENLGDGWVRINLRLLHHEVAQIIGASREACTHALGRLQRTGMIHVEPDHHIVLRQH